MIKLEPHQLKDFSIKEKVIAIYNYFDLTKPTQKNHIRYWNNVLMFTIKGSCKIARLVLWNKTKYNIKSEIVGHKKMSQKWMDIEYTQEFMEKGKCLCYQFYTTKISKIERMLFISGLDYEISQLSSGYIIGNKSYTDPNIFVKCYSEKDVSKLVKIINDDVNWVYDKKTVEEYFDTV